MPCDQTALSDGRLQRARLIVVGMERLILMGEGVLCPSLRSHQRA